MLHDSEFWRVLILSWIFTPVGMFVVGIVLESRIIPLLGDQSRAYNPGDIGLGVMIAVGWYLYAQVPAGGFWASWIMPVSGITIGTATCIAMRTKFDGLNNYTLRQLNSPTKRYHDYVLYVVYLGLLIVPLCVPGILFGTSWSGSNLDIKLVAIGGFVVWFAGMIWDGVDPDRVRKSKVRHVDNYQPIWKTFPLWWRELKEKLG